MTNTIDTNTIVSSSETFDLGDGINTITLSAVLEVKDGGTLNLNVQNLVDLQGPGHIIMKPGATLVMTQSGIQKTVKIGSQYKINGNPV